jgi:hypothetical protein
MKSDAYRIVILAVEQESWLLLSEPYYDLQMLQ